MQELPGPVLSVQIPTRGRPEQIAACVRALAEQRLDGAGFEVLIGLDGPGEESARAARQAWGDRPAQNLRIIEFPRAGHLPIRAGLVGLTGAPILVFLNDDVVPGPGFLEEHRRAHAGGEALVVGRTPWAVPPDETLFDRLVARTSLIFFYDRMDAEAGDGARDWGYRHFWTLNASAPRRAVEAVGGFAAYPGVYGHEDIELAFRIQRRRAMPVLYRSGATAVHHHRYRPADVMAREVALGRASWRFAVERPDFSAATFGCDLSTPEEIGYARAFVERERRTAERLGADFERLALLPPDAASDDVLPILAGQFTLLKRHLWRRGVLEAAANDGAPTLPRPGPDVASEGGASRARAVVGGAA